ncbi:MAG: response regulator transcription factor [Bacteroidales bacterium]|nr:response regulator transcription factor [Bacteroidales bacterium]MBQ3677650.1 response regulator transcription factor [Bacteroidales bacterium]MBR4497703.1 response regulator transcription factor [Bacteroidales bacterium]MBR4689880.1 response regulator transcription factor [Bacteroidales bacterium]MBR7034750.1 response regulator transcription factor [Bacteroidales bacterium]
MEKLSIHLVDDHSLFREGLKFLLSNCDFISEIEESENGKIFLEKLDSKIPDVVLMDIEMPEIDGITASKIALEKYPNLKIIALSMYAEEEYYSKMIDVGVRGFLLKNSQFEDVQKAILDVSEGNNFFSQEILDRIIANMYKKKTEKPILDLTEREIEVLYNICKGLSNQEIADLLFISKRTVDKHRENLLLKTEAKNTAGLVVYAIKNGIFEV